MRGKDNLCCVLFDGFDKDINDSNMKVGENITNVDFTVMSNAFYWLFGTCFVN